MLARYSDGVNNFPKLKSLLPLAPRFRVLPAVNPVATTSSNGGVGPILGPTAGTRMAFGMGSPSVSTMWDRYLENVCLHETGLRYLFIVSLLSTVILSAAFTMIEAGTATYYVTTLQLITFVPLMGFSLALLLVCSRREAEDRI